MRPFKKYVLKNGLRIVLIPNPQNLATTALILIEAGSKYETKNINGVSHFLEHMCFKGTKKRPTALALASEIESLGAVFNAFTGHELTGYFAKVSPEKIDKALEIVSDLYLNPVFNEKEFEKEKGVIIEEINMYEDLPMKKVHDLFLELMYGGQPAGRPVIGDKEIIRSMARQNLLTYRKIHYVPKATAVIVAGAFDKQKMLKGIEKLFGAIPEGEKSGKEKVKELQKNPQSLVYFKESDQTHLVLGLRAFDMYDERKYALEILGEILGGGMSSRLFQKIREELGAAYYVKAGADLFTDHGFLAAFAGVDHTKLEIVIKAILEEFNKIKSKPVSKKELDKAKNHLIGNFMIELETSDSLAGFYGRQELFKEKILAPQEMVERFKAVTAGDVLLAAKDIVKNQGLNLALIGPFKDGKKFEKILKL